MTHRHDVRADIPLAGGRRNERPRGLPPSRYFKALTFHASGQVAIRLLSDRHRTRRITPLGAMAEATPHPPRPVSLVNRAGRGSLRWGIPSSGCRGRTLGFRLHEHSPAYKRRPVTAPSSLCHASTEPTRAIQHATDRSGICSVRAGALPEAEWPRGIRRQQSQRERAGDDEQRSEDSRALRHEADERRAG